MDSPSKIHLVVNAALDKQGERPEVLALANLAGFTDYFVIVSGKNHPHVEAVSRSILDALERAKVRTHHVEGVQAAEWVLIDLGDVVVHVFLEGKRLFYDLEGLWRDARRLPVAATV